MTTTIKIIQRDNDKTDYETLIFKLLNKRFTSQESMELHWQSNCHWVAQELGGRLVVENDYITFDFTI